MSGKKSLSLEEQISELESLIKQMEQGDISLEESLAHFERGVELTRNCQKALREAEQKVQILVDKEGASGLEPFDHDD